MYHIEERQKRNWRSFFKGHKSPFSSSSWYYTQITWIALRAGKACFWQRQHVLPVLSASHNIPAPGILVCVSTQAMKYLLSGQAANVHGRKSLGPLKTERKHVLAQIAWGDFWFSKSFSAEGQILTVSLHSSSAAAHLHTTLSWEVKGTREVGCNTMQELSYLWKHTYTKIKTTLSARNANPTCQ